MSELPSTLGEALNTYCRLFGESPHLVDSFGSSHSITYNETLEHVQRAANWVLSRSTGNRPRHIGILAENSSYWSIGFYAVVYSGATAVPLDIRQSETEIETVAKDADLSFLLVSPVFENFARKLVSRGLVPAYAVLGAAWLDEVAAAPALSRSLARPDDLAAIIYTSGTTGAPKGVMLTHACLVNQAVQNISMIAIGRESGLLAILPLNHIFIFVGTMTAMASGGRVIFIDSLKPARILETLKKERVTHFCAIPLLYDSLIKGIKARVKSRGYTARIAFRGMTAVGWQFARFGSLGTPKRLFAALHREFAPDIQQFISGGAKARRETIRAFLSMGYNFQEGYGLTETCGGIIANPVFGRKTVGAVGKTFGNTEVTLKEGEVCVRGPSRFVGYYKKPDATAAVIDEEGWFHTGDLGEMSSDGTLTITGRAKEIIVLASGKKVIPEELEFHFSQSTRIEEVAALGRQDAEGEKIHLVVVPSRVAGTVEFDDAALRREILRLAAELAPYKRPQGLTIRREPLPRTSTRKLRRAELSRWLSDEQSRGQNEGVESGSIKLSLADQQIMDSPEMAAVIRACSSVTGKRLRPSALSPTTMLSIDLGVDSLTLIELATALEGDCGVAIPMERLGTVQTLGDLQEVVVHALVDARARGQRVEASGEIDWKRVLRANEVSLPRPGLMLRLLQGLAEWFDAMLVIVAAKLVYRLKAHNRDQLPRIGPFILAPNHVSYFDFPVVMGMLPGRIRRRAFAIGKAELRHSRIGKIFGAIHRMIPVERSGNVMPALMAGAQVLKDGKVLYLHPEGTRSASGQLQPLKRGVAILAREMNVPVIPVHIQGTFDVFPPGKKMPRFFNFRRFRRWKIDVHFGEPILPVELASENDPYEAILQKIELFLREPKKRG